jgi:hypothetical protein
MSFLTIAPQGTATVTLTAGQKIQVQTQDSAVISQVVGYPNYPSTEDVLATVTNGTYTSSAFASGAVLIVQAGGLPVVYDIGTEPVVSIGSNFGRQGAPVVIPDGGSMAITAAELMSGLITATPSAGRNVQLPTAAAIEAATTFAVDDSFDFSVQTLAAFALTITTNTGLTLQAAGAIGPATAGFAARYRLRKTAAGAFSVYRIA